MSSESDRSAGEQVTPAQGLAQVFVDELARCGVRHVVLCPGSRSAPLAYALLAADRRVDARRIRLHVRVDERSAAFLALGLARGSRRPAAVVTTSGTAVANLHPAVLEAHEAGVPLLLLTADRPPELRGTRANQTTQQVGLFAEAVRWAHDLGVPEALWPGQAATWRTVVDRAVAAATGALGGEPGPVHLNLPLRDPLAPSLLQADATPAPDNAREADDQKPDARDRAAGDERAPNPVQGRPGGAPWTATPAAPPPTALSPHLRAEPAVTSFGDLDLPGDRTLVLLGDLGDADGRRSAQVVQTARRLGVPVLAEPFGTGDRAGVIPHGPLLLAASDLLREAPPERILVVGRLTLSREFAALLRTPGVRVEVVADSARWPDPGHVAHRVYPWSTWRAWGQLAERAGDREPRPWAARWFEAGRTLHDLVEAHLAAAWRDDAEATGVALAQATLRAVPAGAVLFVGSSNSARDVELARGPRGPLVVANRGLAGIDGCLSTATGLALARADHPTYALVGDLTFLHDANALAIGPAEPVPDLTIVLADDRGGGIFATLEYGDPARRDADSAGYERIFATPTDTDVAALCAAHGVPYERITGRADLAARLAPRPRGLRVLHVPIRRDAARAERATLNALAALSSRP
ncbi:2-succinyl-5-enolpyruvyl-6-hydroxy-3-cyclohexene-1-carboxylate synthase [Kineosphaera limosa]|nr:2-succinyl-5-enolpyruvyl-6-hydroxy-3-cyclohexene-1-carboxylic-acid synthase [Kineosphaera limosa]NYE02261.1 2-succinyl-5-enolpyruvyl-6-hydroxy-3-cyclohexene-1-carboxylate synthase [Kineosphaera limosa]